MKPNGFIVQSYEESIYGYENTSYKGISRYKSWPLENHDDSKSLSLTAEAWKLWFGYSDIPLMVIPEPNYVITYLNCCELLNLPTRTLLISSHNKERLLDDKSSYTVIKNLGYEYSNSALDYSASYDELSIRCHYKFDRFIDELNEYGTFSDINSIISYVKVRKQLLIEGVGLEILYKPQIILVQEVKINR